MKALITTFFLCFCGLQALASSLVCTPGTHPSHDDVSAGCITGEASFVNDSTLTPNDPDESRMDMTMPIELTGQIFFPLNYQMFVSIPLTDGQMKSLLSNAVSANEHTANAAQSAASASGDPAASGSAGATFVPNGNPELLSMTDPSSSADAAGPTPPTGSVNSSAPAATTTDPAATPENTSIAMIGSGLIFLSLVANSTRKRKRQRG